MMTTRSLQARSLQERRELAEFIRSHREKLTPAAIGLAAGSRRRTPGLRREELAQLCGLSVTWYTWIEQGRDVSVSPSALVKLADALRLNRAERSYLFALAGKRDPDRGTTERERIPPAALGCVEMIASPAYILDRTWTPRSWNALAEKLFVGWLDQPGRLNLLHFIFLRAAARTLISGWEERARRVAAEFRADCSAHLNDPSLRLLIDGLCHESPEFARLWDEHGVLGREGGERTFNHPSNGFLRFEQVTFNLVGRPDLKLTILLQQPG